MKVKCAYCAKAFEDGVKQVNVLNILITKCPHCKKFFRYSIQILRPNSRDYLLDARVCDVLKLPCRNKELECSFKATDADPKWATEMRCEYCGKTRTLTLKERKELGDEYKLPRRRKQKQC